MERTGFVGAGADSRAATAASSKSAPLDGRRITVGRPKLLEICDAPAVPNKLGNVRAPMTTFCQACNGPLRPGTRFCAECGAAILAVAEPPPSTPPAAAARSRLTRRQMTMLFCDLVGSTELAGRIDPEDLLEVLSAFGEMVKRVATRFGGFVARVVGDGADVYFGYPLAGEDDAVRALHAGLAIVEETRRLKEDAGIVADVQVRIGISTGLVAVGAQESLAIAGGAPNLAARIQAVAKPGQVVISPSTRRIAGGQFCYEDLGLFDLKGFAEPVRLTAVTGSGALASRSAWRGHDTIFPLVGRDAELALLLDAWASASAERVTGVLVVAEAGLGKSRLASDLDRRFGPGAHTTLRLQCSPFHSNSILQPVIQHFVQAAGFACEDTPLIQLEKLEAQLAIAGIDDDLDRSLIASLMSIRSADRYPPLTLAPPAQLHMTKDALRRYFAGLASRPSALDSAVAADRKPTPLLLIVEDLHWIDPTSFELVDLILSSSEPVAILVLMTTRPESQPAFTTEPRTIRLGRLEEGAAREMATHVAAEIALPATAIDSITERSDGVPLYIEEMTRMMMESQALYAGAAEGGQPRIPDTLMDLLMERLDRLGPGKWLAQVGSVIGHEFGRRLLYTAADMDRAAFDEALNAMLSASLVLPGDTSGERFVFKHALVEDAAYGSITPKTRIGLHARLAEVLMREFAEAIVRQPELAARHLSRAHRHVEASRYFLQAGGQALGRGAPREAAAHLAEGVAILANVPPSCERSESELALLSVLGPTTMVLRGPGSQAFFEVQQRAHTLCHELPGAPRQFPITYGLCLYHWGRAELETASRLADELLKVAESRADDAEAVMAANTMNGMIKLSLGDPRAARAHLERSVARYEPQRDAALYPIYLMDFGVFGRFYLALSTLIAGDEERATRQAREAYELAGTLNQPHTLGLSMIAIVTVAVLRDQPALARDMAGQCIAFSSQMGFSEFVGMARIARGWATARQGELESGLDDLDAGIRLWQATGFENWQSWYFSLRVGVLAELGRREEALREIEIQVERIDRSGENLFRSVLLAQKAALLIDDPATAAVSEILFDQALQLAASQGAEALSRRIEACRAGLGLGGRPRRLH